VARKSRIIERQLLDNGSAATNLAPLSGQQRIYNGLLQGNATIVSNTEPLSKVSPRPSECGIYQRDNQGETTREETQSVGIGLKQSQLASKDQQRVVNSYQRRLRREVD
jgi:hypothetical protein